MSAKSATPAEVVFPPEFIAGVKDMFENKIVFNQVMGMQITHVAAHEVQAELKMRHELIGHFVHKRIHGGVIAACLDALGGLAVMTAIAVKHLDEPVDKILHRFAHLGTIDLRIDYLRPGVANEGECFTMQAHCLRLGSRVANTRMEFLSSTGTLLATGAAAYIVA